MKILNIDESKLFEAVEILRDSDPIKDCMVVNVIGDGYSYKEMIYDRRILDYCIGSL